MSLVIDIAQGVADELNAAAPGTFNEAFTAARHYRPMFELAELKTLHVTVVPKGIEITSMGRSVNLHEVSIDIAVQQAIDPADHVALDDLMELVQRIMDYFRLRRLSTPASAIWSRSENAPVYAPEHLEQMRVFTSVVTVTFKVIE